MQIRDKNFDDLAEKFSKKVYGDLKGQIRLAVLKNDLNEFCPAVLANHTDTPLQVLDAGSGSGPFSLYLAQHGHQVTLVDHSQNMLDLAGKQIRKLKLENRTTRVHSSIQNYTVHPEKPYDLVLCHAVIEWVEHPGMILSRLIEHLKSGGIFSLTFYNLNGMIYKNLLRTNYKKILKQEYAGWEGSLTPTHPLDPDTVIRQIREFGLKLLCHSGMRVFHDYILDLEDRKRHPETVIELEKKFSRVSPFRELGRYQHLLLKKA